MRYTDELISNLLSITDKFLFIEYYPHTRRLMFKILNEFTTYASEKLVLCPLEDGIERALEIAIQELTKKREESVK